MPPADREALTRRRGGPILAVLKRLHTPIHEWRIRSIARRITPHLREGDRVLDVGCGAGFLGRAILDTPSCPAHLHVNGMEQHPREEALVDVQGYDGVTIPHGEQTYDVVILADVLHHADDPERLIRECLRVSRRLLIIKDHQVKGLLARERLALLDWMANAPFGIPCLYRFLTAVQWTEMGRRHRLTIEEEITSMNLFPWGLNLLFGGDLHYFVVFRVPAAS